MTDNIVINQSSSEADASVTSSNVTQTRFSFYNADDFIPKSASSPKNKKDNNNAAELIPPAAPVAAAAAAAAATTTGTRFRFYNSDAEEEKEKQHQQLILQKEPDINNMDSDQILRSLQQHEQQRLEILGGGGVAGGGSGSRAGEDSGATSISSSSKAPSPRKNIDTTSTTRQEDAAVAAASPAQQHQQQHEEVTSLAQHAAAASAVNANANDTSNNPYEDAIKEALDLLRKHRTTVSSTSTASSGGSLAEQQQTHRKSQSQPKLFVNTNTSVARPVHGLTRTPAEADRVLQCRAAQGGYTPASASGVVDHAISLAINTDNPLPSPPGSDVPSATSSSLLLGEAYQAEIETRRKQRQERMAKYASRLAELKQEQDTSWTGQTQQQQQQQQQHVQHPSSVTSHKTTEADSDLSSTQRQQDDDDRPFFHVIDNEEGASTSQAGSVSTITGGGGKAKDDEVQRGVEKVLLAILERANSNCRSPMTRSSSIATSGGNDTTTVQSKQSWQQGEEKKSNTEQDDMLSDEENSLLQAMSDLLRTGGGGVTAATEPSLQQPRPQAELLEEERQQQPVPALTRSYHDDFDPVTASRSADDDTTLNNPEPTAPDAHNAATPNTSLRTSDRNNNNNISKQVNSYQTELSDTAGGIEAVDSSDDHLHHVVPDIAGPSDELDELVRKLSGSNSPAESASAVRTEDEGGGGDDRNNSSNPERAILTLKSSGTYKDDSIDERVRRILDENNNDGNTRRRHHGDLENSTSSFTEQYTDGTMTDNYDDDDDDEGSNEDAATSLDGSSNSDGDETATVSSYDSHHHHSDDSVTDHTDDELDPHNDTIDGVLGPLNKRAGGRTGVVLEPDSPKSDDEEVPQPSILESLSAAMSLVTGNASTSSMRDKYSTDELGSDDHGDDNDSDIDSEAYDLMRSLCAHLLPVGVNIPTPSNALLGKQPEWDEGNRDEPGYRIVRLTGKQLRRTEHEFENMVENLNRSSQNDLRRDGGSDEAFERDLKAAEELLDQEEERVKAAETAVDSAEKSSTTNLLVRGDSKTGSVVENGSCSQQHDHEEDEEDASSSSGGLATFPGVKKAGKGEMGDLEYFHLPIIFKSHVTGFEPTKDLFLEAGNIVAGQYLVEGELGSAAFSTAYRCIDLNSDGDGPDGHEEVCLKVIKNTKDFFDQSLDEIKILELLRQTGKCQEKAIVEMKTFFYHREHLIIVTELLRQNLFEFGKFIVEHDEEPYFTLPRLAYITRQVLIALDFVHKLGLVHSDVKPENVLLGSYSRSKVKLIDFGSSCYLTDRQSSYIQSRSYRAPEVVLGMPYDGRIDVWSLGCVVAEMFTGEVTFQNDSIVSMLSRIESICGTFPRHMIAQGRQSGRFFTKCGLLFENVTRQEDTEESSGSITSADEAVQHFDIFQPKITTLAARLGFEMDLLELYDNGGTKLSTEQFRRAIFVDFVRKLLTIDPETRPTAKQALQHPLMQYAETLTEEDIKYPSS